MSVRRIDPSLIRRSSGDPLLQMLGTAVGSSLAGPIGGAIGGSLAGQGYVDPTQVAMGAMGTEAFGVGVDELAGLIPLGDIGDAQREAERKAKEAFNMGMFFRKPQYEADGGLIGYGDVSPPTYTRGPGETYRFRRPVEEEEIATTMPVVVPKIPKYDDSDDDHYDWINNPEGRPHKFIGGATEHHKYDGPTWGAGKSLGAAGGALAMAPLGLPGLVLGAFLGSKTGDKVEKGIKKATKKPAVKPRDNPNEDNSHDNSLNTPTTNYTSGSNASSYHEEASKANEGRSDGGWGWAIGGDVTPYGNPDAVPNTGGSMNIKKFTQKNADGSSISYEFDVPKMQSIPHPGEPKGTDTVPAWLTPGEFVMNAEATRMFEPQIEAMNNAGRAVQAAQGGTIPEYAARGGCMKSQYKAKGGKPCDCEECSGVAYKAPGGKIDSLMDIMSMFGFGGSEPTPPPTAPSLPPMPQGYQGQIKDLGDGTYSVISDSGRQVYGKATPEEVMKVTGVDPRIDTETATPVDQPLPLAPEAPPVVDDSSYYDKLAQAESSGRADAESKTSSATGLHQFTEGTWLDVVNKYEPNLAEGMSKEQLLDLRKDPEVSRRMVGYLTEENRSALEKQGLDSSDGSLYLSHFLGSGAARDVLSAQPNTPIGNILPKNVIEANKSVLENKTVGEVKAWAQGKMGNKSSKTLEVPEEDQATQIPMPQNRNFVPGVRGRGRDQGLPSPTAVQQARDEREEFREDKLQTIRERIAKELPPIHNYTQNDLDRLAKEELERQEGQQEKDFDDNYVEPATTPEEEVEVVKSATQQIMEGGDASIANRIKGYGIPDNKIEEVTEQVKSGNISSGILDSIGSALSRAFDNLFDSTELAEAGILYLASRAMGYSHGGSLQFVGQNYAKGIQTKNAMADKLLLEGKHNKESIEEYRRTGDMSKLQAKGVKPKRVGAKPEVFYTNKGNQKINLFEYEDANGDRYLGDKQGNPINMDALHNDPSIVPKTPEFNKAARDSTTAVSKIMKEVVETTKQQNDNNAVLKIGPDAMSDEIGRWAAVNGIDVNNIGRLSRQAYADAVAFSQRTGNKVDTLVPYLNQQSLRTFTKTIDPSALLSKETDKNGNRIPLNPVKLRSVNKAIALKLGTQLGDARVSDIMNQYMAAKIAEYDKLDNKDYYENRANDDENGFLLFMQEDLKISNQLDKK